MLDTGHEITPFERVALENNDEMVRLLQKKLRSAPMDLDTLQLSIVLTISRKAWQDRLDPQTGTRYTYGPDEFPKFVRDHMPAGLGTDDRTVERLLKDFPDALVEFHKAIGRPQGGQKGNQNASKAEPDPTASETNRDDVTVRSADGPERGNAVGYAVRRLTREGREDLLEKVKTRELSANAAMIEAGFRAKSMTVPVDPERAARVIVRNLALEDVERLRDLLTAFLAEAGV